MNWKLVGLLMTSLVLGGCSLLGRTGETNSSIVHDADENVTWRVGQMDAARDSVSGDLVLVFCKREECTVSQKTLTMYPARGGMIDFRPNRKSGTDSKMGEKLFRVPFEYDKSSITAKGLSSLIEASNSLGEAKKVKVVGLADSVNRDEYNLALAKRRAEAVQEWLRKRFSEMGKSIDVESDARIVRVTEDGIYPKGETFKGRRVDLTVLVLEVK